MEMNRMEAGIAAAKLRAGDISSEQLVQACLDRIADTEEKVGAWAFLDPDYALQQAREADLALRAGTVWGPLHGVPVGVKDIFDTADMPTENGTILHAGRQPGEDATTVALLRQGGAVILGKTVTAELAVYAPGKTTNPHDERRTPGGSSSGSAASVADFMAPLALGTQTNGSVIRPASFCGVYGFKPSFGRISRHGILKQAPSLDQVGIFGRSVEDVALLAEALMGFDPRDKAMWSTARPGLFENLLSDPPIPPRLAFVKSPVWDQATATAQDVLTEFARSLDEHAGEVALSPKCDGAVSCHRTIMLSEMAANYAGLYDHGREAISTTLRGMIEEGQQFPAAEYITALKHIPLINDALEEVFTSHDAIMTLSAPGEAPVGLESTGSPIFSTLWTLCGLPAISLPLLAGEDGMPLGVQLVGPRNGDARLLRTARWLAATSDRSFTGNEISMSTG